MSLRQAVGSRPTVGGLLLVRAAAAMSLLCRCRTFHHHSYSRPLTTLHQHLSGMMAACPGAGASSVQSTSSSCLGKGGRVGVTMSMAAFASSAAAARTSLRKSVGRISRVRARADGKSALRGSSVGGYSRVGGRGGLGQIQQTSGRRRRTSLGMVSDQPFRGPQAEPMEAMRFQELGLLPELVESMDDFGFESPSKIQRKAVPQILSGGNIVLAAETGSGKTLAYLLPLIQQLKAQEMLEALDAAGPTRRTQRPRALVLVPTRELAVQVLEVAKRVSRTCKFSSCGVIGGEDYGKQKRQLAGTVDIVVASPGRLLKHQEQGNFFMSQVTHIVIDEVDTMLTQGFGADIEKLTRPILSNPERVDKSQFVFVTATLTRAVRKLLDEGKFPKVRMLETRDVHHSLPSLKHIMIDIKGRDKMSALVDVVQQYHKEFKSTLVFCNTVKSCRAAEFGLREVDVPTLSYHGEVPSDERTSNLERFRAGEVEYLVCTDIAARGLDMPDVQHVVMFDFPLNPIDYLHRSGRTARMGASGMVTSLLAKRDIVLAAAIERAVQAGMPLDELSSRRTDYASGAKLGPVFGRKGVVKNKGNHHALKATINIRARCGVSKTGERLGAPRKTQKTGAAIAAAGGRRYGGAAWGRGTSGGKSGPGRARKYN